MGDTEKPARQMACEDAEALLDEARLRAGGPLRAFDGLVTAVCETMATGSRGVKAPPLASAPFSTGPHAGRGIVLKSRCAVELGGIAGASRTMVLATADTRLVADGLVTIAGSDLHNLEGADGVPFVQVIVAAGRTLTGADHQVVEQCQSVKDYIDGYFVRVAPDQLLARVGRPLFDAGFSLPYLGSALIELARAAHPGVEAAEVFFAVGSDPHVEALCALGAQQERIAHDLRRDTWLEKGLDIDCPNGGHCGACGDKEVCDQVRRIQNMRRSVLEAERASEVHDAPQPVR